MQSCNPNDTTYVSAIGKRVVLTPDNRGNDELRHSSNQQKPLTAGLPNRGDRRMGGLEKEDFVILVLSIILVVATIWLATRVL
jgi:hypothetical protein